MALDENEIRKLLTNIPNSVSGDGKVFVTKLKRYLTDFLFETNKKIDEVEVGLTERPAHVDKLSLVESHTINDGVRINLIQIGWEIGLVDDYAKAEIWYKTANNTAWEKAGESSGTQYTYSGAVTGETYFIKVVSVNSKGVAADFDTALQGSIKIKGSQYAPKTPTQFTLTWDEHGALWTWLFEDNGYVDFFELRLDQNPSIWNENRLDSTRETYSRANPKVRSGTAYLYIRNIFGEYSEPAIHFFTKEKPQKPYEPIITSTIDGVSIKMQTLPADCTYYKLYIKTTDDTGELEDYFTTSNSEFIYFFFSGTVSVRYCFCDDLGEGEWSDLVTAECKPTLDIGQIPEIDYDKFSDEIKETIDRANNQPSINEDLIKKLDTQKEDLSDLVTKVNANTNGISQNKDNITSIFTTIAGHGTAIEQNANSITMLAKDVQGNTSSIQQNAESITSIVTRVNAADTKITNQGTLIQQNADSITSLAQEVQKNKNSITDNTTQIQQTATDLTAIAQRVTQAEKDITVNKSSIEQNADSITSVVSRVTTAEGTISNQGSIIKQNSDSINSVVTELGKDPADCNYSAISQLNDDILLTVKKDDVINSINVSKEGIVIDGSKIHITGNTVFDKNVIVGEALMAESVATEHLKANAVTSAKIQANAVTSDKITAGAVTSEKIEAGAITAEKIQAGAIGTDALQAGSVVGDKISANSIRTSHLASENIDLTGALTITGGNVKLSEEGLRLSNDNGSYTLFNQDGINYVDKNGIIYAQVKKMIIGKAYDGSYIRFAAPWDTPPSVLVIPMTIQTNDINYQSATLYIVSEATNITTEGFIVNNYLRLAEGSYHVEASDISSKAYNPVGTDVVEVGYGSYTYRFNFYGYVDMVKIIVPNTSTYIELQVNYDLGVHIPSKMRFDYPGSNSGGVSDCSIKKIVVQLFAGSQKIKEVDLTGVDKNFILSGYYEAGTTEITVRTEYILYYAIYDHMDHPKLLQVWKDNLQSIARQALEGEKVGDTINIPTYKYSAADSKIARGYAMFLVTDGSTNTFTVELPNITVWCYFYLDDELLTNTAIMVNGEERTTNNNGSIALTEKVTAETNLVYIFSYNGNEVKQPINFTDNATNTVNFTTTE